MKLLEGKTAIITGASRGIGRGIAKVFVAHGCAVAFTYSSNKEAADALEKELSSEGVLVKGYQSNAADFDQAQQLVDEVLKDFGGLDVLINNAGITKDNLLMRMSEEDFDSVIEVNLKSIFNMTKAVQRTFLKQRKGLFDSHELSSWSKRKCWTSKLCCFKSRDYWIFKICSP
jgi:3-oxoacyl-[acyl-carrier protein] reductase